MNIRFEKIISIMLLFVFMCSLFAACGSSKKNIENSGDKHMSSSFEELSKEYTKEIKLIEGQTLNVTYDIKLLSGTLIVKLVDPNNNEIIVFDNTQNGVKDIEIEISGTYKIIVIGKDAEGSYDLRWKAL